MDDSSDEQADKYKNRMGILEKIRKFSSREELSNVFVDEDHKRKRKKGKEKRKQDKDDDQDEKNKGHKRSKYMKSRSAMMNEEDSSEDEVFVGEMLAAANRYRKKHGVKKLRPDKEVSNLLGHCY